MTKAELKIHADKLAELATVQKGKIESLEAALKEDQAYNQQLQDELVNSHATIVSMAMERHVGVKP